MNSGSETVIFQVIDYEIH